MRVKEKKMKYWKEDTNRAAFEYAKVATAVYSKSFLFQRKCYHRKNAGPLLRFMDFVDF
jgi:hypothetical protein